MSVLTGLTRLLFFFYGTICPAYQTYKVLSQERIDEFYDWSKYWIVYALLVCTEMIADILLAWIPFYTLCKLLLVLVMVYSAPQASVWFYDSIVDSLLSGHQHQIEQFLKQDKQRLLRILYSYAIGLLVSGKQLATIVILKFWERGNETAANMPPLSEVSRQLMAIEQLTDQTIEQNSEECDTHSIEVEPPVSDNPPECRDQGSENDVDRRSSNFKLANDMKMEQISSVMCHKPTVENTMRGLDVPLLPSETERNGAELQGLLPTELRQKAIRRKYI